MVFITYVRERRARELSRVRSVAETGQRIPLRPPPRRVGPLRVAWLYLAAEDEAQIGGDLSAVARAAHPGTRVLIGDVRGHGPASIGEASVVMGAFREGAHRYDSLPASSPDALLHHLHRDLPEHTGEQLTDAAFLIVERTPSRRLHRPHLMSHAGGGSLPSTIG